MLLLLGAAAAAAAAAAIIDFCHNCMITGWRLPTFSIFSALPLHGSFLVRKPMRDLSGVVPLAESWWGSL